MQLVSLNDFLPLPEGELQYPLDFIEAHRVIKLSENDTLVVVGVTEGTAQETIRDLKTFHRKRVLFHRLEGPELSGYLGKKLSADTWKQENRRKSGEENLSLDKLANDAPIVNLVNSYLIEGIRTGASDIHIERFENTASLRYRLDGVLRKAGDIDVEKFPAISSRIKIMANLNIMEKRLPQDGRISVDIGGQKADVRVSIVPLARGESLVLRLFNVSRALLSLDELGFDRRETEAIRDILKIPHGLFLVTGPTGSGKTTTLNAALRELDATSRKILTIEDPVEYLIEGVNQIQTNEKIGLTFDMILRRVLRQDPNIIMVGEIRDSETAELAVRAALTGHLVLSTLHTNDSVSAITRLIDMGVEPYLLAAVLRGVLAQRLVRKICPFCKRVRPGSSVLKGLLERFGFEGESVYEGVGCDSCHGTGYKGRIALGEHFRPTKELEEMIARKEDRGRIIEYLRRRGMVLLIEDGMKKVAQGLTGPEEVEAAVMF